MGEFPNKATQFSSTNQPAVPGGVNKKGSKHISTHIQNMLDDDAFESLLEHPTKGYIEFKGAPIKAIIQVAIRKAQGGDNRWAEWLAKYGYGQKFEVDQNISGQLATGIQDPKLAEAFAKWLKEQA